uniref:Uncharacterized protein n=1 Tax=Oryza glumipatula TaxID=40148 RepID=A0A0D9YZ75_9ORYZ
MRSPEQMAGHAVAPRREAPFRATTRRAVSRRRKKMAVVRLGDGSRRPRRFMGGAPEAAAAVGVLVVAMYRRALRRLRACYAKAIRDILEGAALVGAVRADAGETMSHTRTSIYCQMTATGLLTAVVIRADLIAAGLQLGRATLSMAATPRHGRAIDDAKLDAPVVDSDGAWRVFSRPCREDVDTGCYHIRLEDLSRDAVWPTAREGSDPRSRWRLADHGFMVPRNSILATGLVVDRR